MLDWGMFCQGLGVKRDYVKGAKWLRKAADQNYPEAQNILGALYQQGTGVKKDYAEAARWYQRAAEQGNGEAQYNLALLYLGADGIQRTRSKP